jgi:lysophospholipase L1-like esterase
MPLSKAQKGYIKKHYSKQSSIKEIASKIQANSNEVRKYIEKSSLDIDPGKRRTYNLIALLIPVIILLLLEAGLQIFKYGGQLDLFISAQGEYSEYKMCNPYIGRRYFALQSVYPDPSNDLFLKVKPDNGYRIFVLGGSTAAGYPYSENLMFSRILQYRLEEVFPEKHIEVVNTATAAINSYTLLDFMDEVLENQPDAILIYAGHNEFYGALGVASTESLGKYRWAVELYLKLEKYRTFLLLRDLITKVQTWIGNTFGSGSAENPSATLMERLVADQKILYKSSIYEKGKKQFRANLNEILKRASEADVKALVSELVSNIKDQRPFESVPMKDFPSADDVFETALSLQKEQRYAEAYRKYHLAKDLDALRFRASEEFNQVIHQIGDQYNVPVVGVKSVFEDASPNRLIGNNLMLEHLHPNIDGVFLLADAFFDAMRKNGFISDHWSPQRIENSTKLHKDWGYTEIDSLYGVLRIRILKGGWPFKPKSAPNRALLEYHPSTKAESLAVRTWMDRKFTLERAHVEMAEYFKEKKNYLGAYDEFNALMRLTPLNISPYLEAAKTLVQARKLEKALPILYNSLEIEETAYANKWIGQILLDDGFVEKSLPYLKKAYGMNSADPQVLYNLSGAYALNAQYVKAKEILDELWEIDPNFPDASVLKKQLDQIMKN